MGHTVEITAANPALADLRLSWNTAIFSDEDGLAPLDSLHQAGDAMVALAQLEDDGATVIGSGIMVGPGLMLTATHVLDEFHRSGSGPVCLIGMLMPHTSCSRRTDRCPRPQSVTESDDPFMRPHLDCPPADGPSRKIFDPSWRRRIELAAWCCP